MDELDAHWRRLIGVVAFLMAAAFILPGLVQPPALGENRVLTRPPPLPHGLAGLKAWRDEVDQVVADRFPARRFLIPALNALRLTAGVSGSDRVIVGRQGWLFYDNGSHLGAARNVPPMSAAETRAWLEGLAGRTEALGAIPYLVLTPPMKETVFPQYAPSWMGAPSPDRPAPRLARLARQAQVGEVIYPHAAVAAQGPQAYSRHDTHWTGYGAYGGYSALMQALRARGLGHGPRPLSAFAREPLAYDRQQSDLASMEGVKGFVRVDAPALIDPAAQGRIKTTWLSDNHSWTGPRVIDTGQVGKPTLLLTVDSFSNALLPLLYGDFSRLVVAHNQDGAWRPDLIAAYHPDAVILEVLESGLPSSLAQAPPASAEAADRIGDVLGLGPTPLKPAAGLATLLDQAPPASCNIETASLTAARRGGWRLRVSGWVSDLGDQPGLATGRVRLTGPAGDLIGDLTIDLRRPDVAAAFHKPAAEASGYDQTLASDALSPGDYSVRVYRRTAKGWVTCLSGQPLRVAPGMAGR